jgi:hypothetical protein
MEGKGRPKASFSPSKTSNDPHPLRPRLSKPIQNGTKVTRFKSFHHLFSAIWEKGFERMLGEEIKNRELSLLLLYGKKNCRAYDFFFLIYYNQEVTILL